ncbi:hypothetical protein AQ610_09250 [Burkholderia humptydooensis]|nr:hypothetical protein AQ610_09250 [Burkholderia humptydooensis]KST74288.1 hypothetical protein WS76_09070 [Burkholderia humptydooensis]
MFFLVKLLRALPAIEDVALIDCGPEPALPAQAKALFPDLPLMAPREAAQRVDVVIGMSGGPDAEWLDHVRARGKKVVYLCGGEPDAQWLGPSVFQRGGYGSHAPRCDEIWVLPKDRAFGPVLEALHRCPVHEVPLLWDPMFIDRRIGGLAARGRRFGYAARHGGRGGTRGLRVAIFEPDGAQAKRCVIPVLACDMAFRAAPDAIDEVRVLDGALMQAHPSFSFLRNSLGVKQAGRLHLDGRHDFADYMSRAADAVVAHHWRDDRNVPHLDALYGGYPLIHNATWLADLGYYYPAFDVLSAARALVAAATRHDAAQADYVRRSRAFLAGLSPLSPANGARYLQRLLHLTAARAGRSGDAAAGRRSAQAAFADREMAAFTAARRSGTSSSADTCPRAAARRRPAGSSC